MDIRNSYNVLNDYHIGIIQLSDGIFYKSIWYKMMLELLTERFRFYKDLGEKALAQLSEEECFWQYNEESNSVAVLVKHLSGNMLSRSTHFFTEDGEKEWRNRDGEFENSFKTKIEMMAFWDKGWQCLFDALKEIKETDLNKEVWVNKKPFSVADALLIQLTHYAYHIGQLVYIAKMLKNNQWKTLSIPRKKTEDKFKDERENSSPVCYANSKEVRDEYKNP